MDIFINGLPAFGKLVQLYEAVIVVGGGGGDSVWGSNPPLAICPHSLYF